MNQNQWDPTVKLSNRRQVEPVNTSVNSFKDIPLWIAAIFPLICLMQLNDGYILICARDNVHRNSYLQFKYELLILFKDLGGPLYGHCKGA